MDNVCIDCGRPFVADHHTDQCGPCWERDTEQFKPMPDLPYKPPKYSKAWNRERLGVIGNVDE